MKSIAKIGVLLDNETCKRRWQFGINVFERYITEILSHAGIPFTLLESVEEALQLQPDILVAAAAPDDRQSTESMLRYAQSGGLLISFAGLNSLASKLGYRRLKEYREGYAELGGGERLSGGGGVPEKLRWLSAVPWVKLDGMLTGEPVGVPEAEAGDLRKESPDGASIGAALQQFRVGEGAIDRWAVNIPVTMAGLMHGTRPVLEDGVPAPDGSAQVNEGILKIDDVLELDWEYDRRSSPGTPFPYFQIPYADLWREAWLGYLVKRALEQGLTIPMVGHWPDGVEQVAHISLDSDHNINEEAWTTLGLLEELQVSSTWCMCVPGYEQAVYDRVLADGHELALHFNAVTSEGFAWGETSFRSQIDWLRRATGVADIVSNKNHVTREEGWGDLFRWCELEGVQHDQTRGPSKKGNGGFAYGTCLPYFPIAWANEENRLYDVLQVGFLLSDFNHMGTDAYVPILRQARRVGGVAHVVLHQTHLHTKEIDREWLRAIVKEAREQGFVFWTGRQINEWERARRQVRVAGFCGEMNPLVEGEVPPGTVVYVPTMESDIDMVLRYGVPCRKIVLQG
ncbi:hypothetical protein [Paenibacillus koleovorans]|uniref:hypothetical protein n=1 Tax=Paenibacillus koleovorans TaxID=121608 RepID=UPI000FD93692|nr:hypothetical protein [Paenibacillus koleovorans]